jgi:hypothetical protein
MAEGACVTASRTIAKRVQPPAGFPLSRATRGPHPKTRLLLLCARIGYSPHMSFQR